MKPPEDCESIEDVRREIDALDYEIITLIDRRTRYVESAAQFKTSESSVRAPERQKAMLEQRRQWSEEEGLDPGVVEKICQTFVEYFIQREMECRRVSLLGIVPVRHR